MLLYENNFCSFHSGPVHPHVKPPPSLPLPPITSTTTHLPLPPSLPPITLTTSHLPLPPSLFPSLPPSSSLPQSLFLPLLPSFPPSISPSLSPPLSFLSSSLSTSFPLPPPNIVLPTIQYLWCTTLIFLHISVSVFCS